MRSARSNVPRLWAAAALLLGVIALSTVDAQTAVGQVAETATPTVLPTDTATATGATPTATGTATSTATGTSVGTATPTPEPPGAGRYEENNVSIVYTGAWDGSSVPEASGGALNHSTAAGSTASLTFQGRAISYVHALGPDSGLAEVLIDGGVVETIDLFAPTRSYQVSSSYNLGPGVHTITIRVRGIASIGSTDTRVWLDSFVVSADPLSPTATPIAAATATATPLPGVTPTATSTPAPAPPAPRDARYFVETNYRIDNDLAWSFFNSRGRVSIFGFPVSRTVHFLGFDTQIFQRALVQIGPTGPRFMNLLDPDIMPFTTINFSVFPPIDDAMKSRTPAITDVDAMLAFIDREVPDTFQGLPVRFREAFYNSVSMDEAFPAGGGSQGLLNAVFLEIWGAPTGGPARDPNNASFVYMRWQRGIMMYDAVNDVTQGILLADYFKSILTGQNLPLDLQQQAQGSLYYQQYCPGGSGWVCRPGALDATDLTFAFERQ